MTRAEPKRIQLRRTRGWRKPEGSIVVARPSKWGNPFTVQNALDNDYADSLKDARQICADAFKDCLYCGEYSEWWFAAGAPRFVAIAEDIDELRGRDLACWCPPGTPCHADVLLEIANR
jgi:hypothetical protein